MQRLTFTFYYWNRAVLASRHWVKVPDSKCRVYKDRGADPQLHPTWVLEVVCRG